MMQKLTTTVKRSWMSHFWINIATTGVLTLSFGLIFGLLLFSHNISKLFTVWGEDIQITAYLKDTVTNEQKDAIEAKLKILDTISHYEYIDKKLAAAQFEKSLRGYGPQFLSALKSDVGNPFPASFQVQLKAQYRQPSSIDEIAASLQSWEGVEDVSFGQEWVKNYTLLARYGRALGIAAGVVILISCLLAVSNSIRASLQTRQEEIEILELIGATAKIIREPFLIEGAFQGALASSLAIIILAVIFKYSVHVLDNIMGSGNIVSIVSFFPFYIWGGMIFLGAVIGALGSYVCVAKINSGWAAVEGGEW